MDGKLKSEKVKTLVNFYVTIIISSTPSPKHNEKIPIIDCRIQQCDRFGSSQSMNFHPLIKIKTPENKGVEVLLHQPNVIRLSEVEVTLRPTDRGVKSLT